MTRPEHARPNTRGADDASSTSEAGARACAVRCLVAEHGDDDANAEVHDVSVEHVAAQTVQCGGDDGDPCDADVESGTEEATSDEQGTDDSAAPDHQAADTPGQEDGTGREGTCAVDPRDGVADNSAGGRGRYRHRRLGTNHPDAAAAPSSSGDDDAPERAAHARLMNSRRRRERRTRAVMRRLRRDVLGHGAKLPRRVRLSKRYLAAEAFRRSVENAAQPRPCAVCARLTPMAQPGSGVRVRRGGRDAEPVASDAPTADEPATNGEESSDRPMAPLPRRSLENVALRDYPVWVLMATHEHGHRVAWGDLHLPEPVWLGQTIVVPSHVALFSGSLQHGASDGTHGLVCTECLAALRRTRIPYASLANFDPGVPPSYLPPLTELEMRLLQDAWMIHLIVPIGRVGDGGEYGLRGNVCAVLKTPACEILEAILSVIPLPVGALERAICVQIVGRVDDVEALKRAARAIAALTGSMDNLMLWAEFLARTQPGRYRVNPRVISQTEFRAAIGRIIDRAVQTAVDRQHRVDEAAVIRGTRVRRGPVACPVSYACGAAGGPGDVDTRYVGSMQFVDQAQGALLGSAMSATLQNQGRVQDLVADVAGLAAQLAGEPRVLPCVPPASARAPVEVRLSLGNYVPLDEFDVRYFAKTFPWLFPYDQGLPPDRNVQRWAAVLLERFPRVFARDRSFVFVVCNQFLRHKWQWRAGLVVNAGAGCVPDLARATPEDAAAAVDVMGGKRLYGTLPTAARAVFNAVHAVAKGVPGMPAAKRRLLQRIRAAVMQWGPAFIMLNFNPADRVNPLVAGFAGRPIVLGATVQQAMGAVAGDAWSSAADPVAVALHFRAFVDAFLRYFLGYDAATRCFAKRGGEPAGAFGEIIGYHATYETNARGALHLHSLLWCREFRCATLEAAVVDERVCTALLAFLSSVSKTSLYETLVQPLDGSGPPPEAQAAREALAQSVLAPPLRRELFEKKLTIAEAQDPTSDWYAARMQLVGSRPWLSGAVWPPIPTTVEGWRHAMIDLIADMQHHVCSSTCHRRGVAGCRMQYPRACIERGAITAELGLRLARDRGNLVAFNDGLLLAARCNVAALVIGDGQLTDERERELTMSIVEATIHVTRYVSKYVSKPDETELHQALLRLVQQEMLRLNTQRDLSNIARARAKLSRLCTLLARGHTMSAVLASSLVLGLGDYNASYDVRPLALDDFVALVTGAPVPLNVNVRGGPRAPG